MKDLGESYDESESMMAKPSPKNEKKKSYPKLCLRDKTIEAVLGKDLPKVGTEFEAEVKLKVCAIADEEYGKRVDFDVVEMEIGEAEESDEEDGSKDA